MIVILFIGCLVEVENFAILFKIHFAGMKGKVFVVRLLFGGDVACGS
jgi:hypothetical protein